MSLCSICGRKSCEDDLSVCVECLEASQPEEDFEPAATSQIRRKPLRESKMAFLIRCHLSRVGSAGSVELSKWICSANPKGIVRYGVPWYRVREWCVANPDKVCLEEGKWRLA